MKGISKNLVFDTELTTNVKVVSLTDCTYGNADVYRTENSNYFIHNHGLIEEGMTENVELLQSEDSLEGLIEEWEDLSNGKVTVYFEEFEMG